MRKLIPDCFWPADNNGSYVSHEAVCFLNIADTDASVSLTFYFEDREKKGGITITVPAERTVHLRLDRLVGPDGFTVPKNTPYALMVESDIDLAVQYTRVDTTQPELALMTTII